MRLNVVGLHLEVTEPIREHAEKKAKKLDKFADLVQQIDIKFWKENSAHENYTVEVVVDVEHHPDFVAKAEGHDLYIVIEDAIAKAHRQLHDHREKLKLEHRS